MSWQEYDPTKPPKDVKDVDRVKVIGSIMVIVSLIVLAWVLISGANKENNYRKEIFRDCKKTELVVIATNGTVGLVYDCGDK